MSLFVRMCFSVIKRETKSYFKKSTLRLLKAVFVALFSFIARSDFTHGHIYIFKMNAG